MHGCGRGKERRGEAESRWKDTKDILKTVKEVKSDSPKAAEQEVIAAKSALDKAKEDRDYVKAKPETWQLRPLMILGGFSYDTWSRIIKKHTIDVP
jgi:hypothetical protein